MQILIAGAKTMTGHVPRLLKDCTEPHFQRVASSIAMNMARYSAEELQQMLGCSKEIARATAMRYRRFIDPICRTPAVFSYDGIAYKYLKPETMDDAELRYANGHLLIASWLYGLLRPLDMINPYRIEGTLRLPCTDQKPLYAMWRVVLTDWLIDTVRADDGILVYLASEEFKRMFDWRRVEQELTVITPRFEVEKGGNRHVVTVYAKMCRGAMTRWILDKRPKSPVELQDFRFDVVEDHSSSGCCPSWAAHMQSVISMPENTAVNDESSGLQA